MRNGKTQVSFLYGHNDKHMEAIKTISDSSEFPQKINFGKAPTIGCRVDLPCNKYSKCERHQESTICCGIA